MNLKERLRNQEINRKSSRNLIMICEKCGQMFPISVGEVCWHYEAGNIIPCKCTSCKEKAKKKNEHLIHKDSSKVENIDKEIVTEVYSD